MWSLFAVLAREWRPAPAGIPYSGEFVEVSELDGKSYTVQYFERAVFEYHPENAYPNDVLLSQLGTFQFKRKYPGGDPSAGGQQPPPVQPTVPPAPQPPSIIGQVIEFPGYLGKGRLRGTVTDVKEAQSYPQSEFHNGVTAKGKFVAIFMTVENIGTESTSVSRYSFKLRDSKGRSFDMADLDVMWAAEAYYNLPSYYTDIQPGLSEQSVFVFDVAPDAMGYLLVPGR